MIQPDLFSTVDMAPAVELPPAPSLVPHSDWPFPGMSPEDSARAAITLGVQYTELLAAIIKRDGGPITDSQVLAAVPEDWRALLGPWAHGHLTHSQGRTHGIHVEYVAHDGDGKGGYHFNYTATANDRGES